jgi:hypothetical protein
MLRISAIQELLLEDVADIRWPRGEEGRLGLAEALDDLEGARRRALGMVLLAALALLALLYTHPEPTQFLSFQGSNRVFALAALTIAFVAGFRLGNWQKLKAVERTIRELAERDGES